MKVLRIISLASALAAVVFGLHSYFLVKSPPPEPGPYLSDVLPGALSYDKPEDGQFPYYVARGDMGTVGALFVTSELVPGVKGYSGEVPVLVGMLPDGRLTGIKILANNETPSYLARVDRKGFTGAFAGKRVSDPFVLDKDIDGVTRATITANAVASGVRLASRKAGAALFGLGFPAESGSLPAFVTDPAFYLVCLLFAASILLYVRGRAGRDVRAQRWAVLAVSLAVIGAYEAMPVSLGNYFSLAALRTPGLDSLAWYLLVIGALALALVWGRIYCGWLCPFGALQEMLARLPVRKLPVGNSEDKFARNIKYGILWAVTIAAFASGLIEIGSFEPYTTLFSGHGDIIAWVLVGATLGGSVLVPRLWCRYLCPVGAGLGLLSRYSLLKRSPVDSCTGCGACEAVCSMGNRAAGEPGYLRSECIGCNACVAVCPERH